MNKVILIGNVGKDPEIRNTEKGKVASLTLATSSGKDQTDWHNVVFFKERAELVEKYVKKGSRIAVVGQIKYESYEKDGVKKYSTKIIANEIEFLTAKTNDENQKVDVQESTNDQIEEYQSDDMPF